MKVIVRYKNYEIIGIHQPDNKDVVEMLYQHIQKFDTIKIETSTGWTILPKQVLSESIFEVIMDN